MSERFEWGDRAVSGNLVDPFEIADAVNEGVVRIGKQERRYLTEAEINLVKDDYPEVLAAAQEKGMILSDEGAK